MCGGEIYSWCLYQQGARSVSLELDEPEMTVPAEPWVLQKPLLRPHVIWMASMPGLGRMPKGTKAAQSAITELLKSTLLRLTNNAAMTWSQDSNFASARTWQAVHQKMTNVVPCLSHILFPQIICIENALWAGTSTNFSFITEKFDCVPMICAVLAHAAPCWSAQDNMTLVYCLII